MSKYKIYRIDHHDPIWIGKRRKRMNIMFSIMSFVFLLIYLVIIEIFNIRFALLYPATMLIITGFYYFFYRKLKAENQKILAIGDIEFNKTNIVKRLGDSCTKFHYDSIKSIELQRHIPALNASESKSGFSTYILKIDFKDFHVENLVVSDRPLGEFHDLSITDTIKTLKRLISTDVIIK
jgi:hypothetical protein